MAALWSRAGHYIFILWFLSIYLSSSLFPRLISAAAHWMSIPYCLPIFVKPSHFLLSDVISKRTTFSQPFLPPSDPPANAPWFILRYRRYINHLLTYLLKHGVALLRILNAGLKRAARGSLKNAGPKNRQKLAIWAPLQNFVGLYSIQFSCKFI